MMPNLGSHVAGVYGPKKVVIAIHGTFFTGPWVKPGSLFSNWIKERCHDIEWTSFQWSGRNSHSAREQAAEQLADKCETILSENPGCEIVLLAHSHGGNVALMAINENSRLREKISKIVCMATPFITVTPRDPVGLHEKAEEHATWLMFFIGPVISLLIAVGLAIQIGLSVGLGLAAWLPVYLLILKFAEIHRDRFNIERILSEQEALLKPYDYTNFKTPLLSLRFKRDEALLHLRVASGAAHIPGKIQSAIDAAASIVSVVLLLAFCLALVLMPLTLLKSCVTGTDYKDSWSYQSFSFAYDSLPLLVLFAIVVPILFSITRTLTLSLRALPILWGEDFRAGQLVDYKVSEAPQLALRDALLTYSPDQKWWKLKLLHSSVYQSKEAAETIASFINERAKVSFSNR